MKSISFRPSGTCVPEDEMATSTRALTAATIVAAAMLLAGPAVACKDDFDRVIQDEDQQDRLDWKFAQARRPQVAMCR